MSAILSPTSTGDATDATPQASLLPVDGAQQAGGQGTTAANENAGGSGEGAGPSDGAASSENKTISPDEMIRKIDEETELAIKKLKEDADRRKSLAIKKAVPLPQRKTNAFDFLEIERDRMRTALAQPLLSDADVDAHIKTALDAWHTQRAAA